MIKLVDLILNYGMYLVVALVIANIVNNNIIGKKSKVKELEDNKKEDVNIKEDKYKNMDRYDKLTAQIKDEVNILLIGEDKLVEVKKTTDKGFVYEQDLGEYKGIGGISTDDCIVDVKEYYLNKGIEVYLDMVRQVMEDVLVIRFRKLK